MTITTPTDGHTLIYDATATEWLNRKLNLGELGDVDLTNLANGSMLVRNATSGNWEIVAPINSFGTAQDTNRPILTNNNGKLDSSLLDINAVVFKGSVDMTAPDALTNSSVGDLYFNTTDGNWDASWGQGTGPVESNEALVWDGTAWVHLGAMSSVETLASMTDVVYGKVLEQDDYLVWDLANGEWIARRSPTIPALADVNIGTLAEGEGLVWDDTAGEWVNRGLVETVTALTDTNIGTLAEGQRISWDDTAKEWINDFGLKGDTLESVDGTFSIGVKELEPVPYLSNRNLLINGDFRVWQRGSGPFTGSNVGSYTADRWRLFDNSGSAQIRDIPSPYHGFDTATISNIPASLITLSQCIEGASLSGKTVTVSFMLLAKAGATTLDNITFRQRGGTDNHVDTINIGMQIVGGYTRYSYTTTLSRDSDSDTLTHIDMDINIAGDGSSEIAITQIQLEEGSAATPFEHRPMAQELSLCQRYYQKSYDHVTTPGTDTIFNCINAVSMNNMFKRRLFILGNSYKVEMRETPTLDIYSIDGTKNNVNIYNNKTIKIPASAVYPKSSVALGQFVEVTSDPDLDTVYSFHYTADAEIY